MTELSCQEGVYYSDFAWGARSFVLRGSELVGKVWKVWNPAMDK